jgi:hypothetical protein
MKSDFVKIIEVTRLAKSFAEVKHIEPHSLDPLISYLDMLKIDFLFTNPKHRIVARKWYCTILEMRQLNV